MSRCRLLVLMLVLSQAAGCAWMPGISGFGPFGDPEAGFGEVQDYWRLMHSAFDRQLYTRPLNAPTVQVADRRLTRATELTRSMGVQFVISGVVRAIGVEDPGAWATSRVAQWSRALGASNQQRRLVVDVFVYDGLSGVMVMSDRLAVRGEWDHAPESDVGFGSPAFFETQFGQRIGERLSELADEVAVNLGCQPFIASVERVEGDRIRISAGADAFPWRVAGSTFSAGIVS